MPIGLDPDGFAPDPGGSAPGSLAPCPVGKPHSGLADDPGAKVPAAAALVIERNVLAGGAGPDEVLLGPRPGGGAPCPACVLSDLLILPVKWIGGGVVVVVVGLCGLI